MPFLLEFVKSLTPFNNYIIHYFLYYVNDILYKIIYKIHYFLYNWLSGFFINKGDFKLGSKGFGNLF